ncbi:MAG: hypothetical protein KZQ64_10140 [gamma proteobacterium symbiont of Bathyaustriella thionipta]|nr:hypothetical protein [gamma proteobacterium symbiont of Bathyaustriella thionipta]MCU7950634.1 hypothetical protein [gamma proteobacterium symbiont of Bathyaustriella thionipta]MCU7953730.1 hypothetical protein [gamma proteobacterium symbiont of Bathyaustriella thionipta]MCU7957148.1 hypothetical protein [gamma proteobacterium symbiont of Bathyaustriella thionipta]MCU7968352.1 hypothetical protein [gamma proteobacterium symbiont of Bathyaustriella thionipta]
MITQETINQIGQSASHEAIISEELVNQFRQRFPDIHFTYCMDDDVGMARPVYENDAFNLYLIDSREHCLCFTQELEIATGIVVAEIDEE